MRADALLGGSHQVNRLKHLVQGDMRGLENRADFHSELLAAVAALTEAKARLAKIVMLLGDGTAVRANRAVRPQNAFKMGESCGFVVEARFRQNGH